MKHLFLLLCASLGLTSFAQTEVSAPPIYKLGGTSIPASVENTVGAKENGTTIVNNHAAFLRPGNFLTPKQDAMLKAAKANTPKMKLTSVKRIDSENARITLDVKSDWGKGDGFEVWIDKECEIENDFCENGVDAYTVFGKSDYVLPEGSTPDEGFLTSGQSASIEIPAGVYDFLVVNPSPSEGATYLVRDDTDSHGDNITFVGGYEYTFTVEVSNYPSEHDSSVLTANANVDLLITASLQPTSGDLSEAETVSMTIKNIGTENCEHIVATYTIDGGETVTEMADLSIPAGGTATYTFNQKADLSAGGNHNVVITVQGEGEALVLEDNRLEKFVMCTKTSIEPPYECDFTEPEDVAEWNIIDADGDNYTWQIEQYAPGNSYRAFAFNCLDDYIVTAVPIVLKQGQATMELSYISYIQDTADKFEVLFGTSNDVESMTVLRTYENINGSSWTNDNIEFEVTADGEYFFAFHACPDVPDYTYTLCPSITNIKIYEGSSQGVPDIKVNKVIVPNSSCNMDIKTIDVEVQNVGLAPIKSFILTASYVGDEFKAQNFEEEIDINGTATVSIDVPEDYFNNAGTLYSVTVTASAVFSPNEVAEENTENNSNSASFVNFEQAEFPFISDFTSSEDGRYYWYGPEGWIYNSTIEAYQALNNTPLISRGIELKAGKTYRLTYNRRAGMDYYGFMLLYDNYKVLCGLNGTDPAEWKKVYEINDDYSEEIFGNKTFEFSVDADGLYQLAFQMNAINQGYTFYLRDVTIIEVAEKDVAIAGATGYLPTRVPKLQAGEFEASVAITNAGTTPASGTVTMTVNDEVVGVGNFTDIAVGNTIYTPVYVTLDGEIGTTTTIKVSANVEGEPESNMYNNTDTVNVAITDDVFGYDKIADNTYYGNQPNNLEVGSIGNGGLMEAGVVFHLNNDARLNGISVGFGQEDEMSAVVLNVYKWYEKEPTASGFHPLSESDLVYTTTVDKEYGTGQFEYAIDDDVNLPAGDYLISARVSTGWPLAVDRKAPGQLYTIGTYYDEGFVAVDQRYSNLGTMAIRAILGEGGGASISTVEGGTSLSLYPNPASETLTITAGEGEITSVAIYSTSGSVMCSSKVQGNSFSCNVSSYTPGIYFAKVTANGKTEVLMFVVK